jgi:hypothetical protein
MFHVEHRCGENVGACGNQSAQRSSAQLDRLDPSTRAPFHSGQSSRKLNCHRDFLLPTPGTRPTTSAGWRTRNMGPPEAPALPPAIAISTSPSRLSRNPAGLSTPTSSIGFASRPPAPARAPSDSAGVPAPDHSRPPSQHSLPGCRQLVRRPVLSVPGRDHVPGTGASLGSGVLAPDAPAPAGPVSRLKYLVIYCY